MWNLFNYSRISRVVLLLAFAETAVNMVLMATAVLPCLPMTFPMSDWTTFSASMDICFPSNSLTETKSGSSTMAWTMASITSFHGVPPLYVPQLIFFDKILFILHLEYYQFSCHAGPDSRMGYISLNIIDNT